MVFLLTRRSTMQSLSKQSIRNWEEGDRPRERLFNLGARALSDSELVALMLRSGNRKENALVLAGSLIRHYGSLQALLHADPVELLRLSGLGPAKAAALAAAVEAARRIERTSLAERSYLREPADVQKYLARSLGFLSKEHFKLLFLDKAGVVRGEKMLSSGTIDEAAVYPREVVQAALDRKASALILVHNHPSGRLQPSRPDLDLTRKLKAVCEPLAIRILDHVIVGGGQYFSLRENGYL